MHKVWPKWCVAYSIVVVRGALTMDVVKKLTDKRILIALIILLFAAQGLTWHEFSKVNQKVEDDRNTNQLALGDMDSALQRSTLTPIPGTDHLYLAELNITVPLTAVTSSLRYTSTAAADKEKGEARLTSNLVTDHTMHVQSCNDMVRLKIEPKPNAYSPSQPLYATVNLPDGRILQVYASTIKECQIAWQPVSPQGIAEAFKAASSY